jgi:hypothetical protein
MAVVTPPNTSPFKFISSKRLPNKTQLPEKKTVYCSKKSIHEHAKHKTLYQIIK